MEKPLSAKQKALKINLMPNVYGTFAEIGAGQETARYFFRAGAASGTVAKSISAYDMVMSDSIYGKEKKKRYVCRPRLDKMLGYEFDLLLERLQKERPETRFFVFANTVETLNYQRTNRPHGWLGVRFQHQPKAGPSDIIVHVRLKDNQNLHQQEALGLIGTNMVFSIFEHLGDPQKLLSSLLDNLDTTRVGIDMVEFLGPAFSGVDNRLMNLELVKMGWTEAVMFNQDGVIVIPSEELYKKNIMVVRGSYRPPTLVNMDILKKGSEAFRKDIQDDDIVTLCEITMKQLGEDGSVANEDFLARVDLLAALNYNVLISNFPQYYHLTSYFSQFRRQNMAIVLGTYNFSQIFNHDYSALEGGIMAAFGKLFTKDVYVYTYPYKEDIGGDVVGLRKIPLPEGGQHLLNYIVETSHLRDIENFDENILHIYSRRVLNMIVNDEKGWEKMVPESVAQTINEKCLFGHPCFYQHKKE